MDKSKMRSKTLKVENCPSHCTTPSDRNDAQLVSVKVGCLHINPSTTRGRRMFMVQMLVLCFVPHAALVIQNCSAMAQLSQTLDSSLYLHTEMGTTLALGETIVDLQEERHLLVKYMFSQNQDPPDKSELERAFSVTNIRLEELPQSFLQELYKAALYRFREDFMNVKDFKKNHFLKRMSVYEDIYSVLLAHITNQVKSTTSSLWRQLSACYELLKSMEGLYLALTFVNYIKSEGEMQIFTTFDQHEAFGLEHLESAVQYLKADNIFDEFRVLNDILDFYKELNPFKRNESQSIDSKERAERLDLYIMESETSLNKLRSIQIRLWSVVRESVKREVWVARRTLAVGVIILSIVVLASPILVLIIRHTIVTIQTFNHSIELSTQRLIAEKQKSDLLLSRMLPIPVLRRLRAQKAVPAEAFDAVTIFFSDIVGFTTISSNSTPMEVINMLNMLYRLFDEKIMQHNVYKVETIGDAYMVVSGLPQRNGNRHASEIADMSLALLRSLDGAMVPHLPEEPLRIRAGVNTGPCVAGVVGTTMPRYCLFGDTINVASRMESTGEAMKIHISYSTKRALEQIGGYEIQSRGGVDVAVRQVVGALTGHFGTNKHLHKIRLAPEPACRACLMQEESMKHLLCECDSLAGKRMRLLGLAYPKAAEYRQLPGKGNMETFWLIGKIGGLQTESPRALRLHDYDQNLLELLIRS